MMITTSSKLSYFVFVLFCFLLSSVTAESVHNDFLQCLSSHLPNNSISNIVYTPNESSFMSILQSSIRNLRFISAPTANPQVIVTPVQESQVPAIVTCAKENGMQIRTRSGGHDYEGLSYTSSVPFVILDLFKMNEIAIDVDQKTAWVQTGATNGQLYYAIGQKSSTLGFPLGACPTVGVGGLFSGGGYGAMLRKYGLAADNIIDAHMVDVNGRLLDRESMGEDVFWAIRGGGGASFGVITTWKLSLVTVPETFTVFAISRTLQQNATNLVHRWQYIAPFLPHDLFISVNILPVTSSENGEKTIQASFTCTYLGGVNRLLQLLGESFPELGVRREDCTEVTSLQVALFNGGYSIQQSPELLASRNPEIPSAILATRFSFKAKLDYFQKPIPKYGWEGMWKLLLKRAPNTAMLIAIPYGGRMSEISESAIPFPHRAVNLFKIQQLVFWNQSESSPEKSLSWVRNFYYYLTPFASKSPRLAYVNYRDLDLGSNRGAKPSYKQASKWGLKYFEHNFERLAQIKTQIDPNNYFKNEQSIPPLYYSNKNK